MSTSKKQKTDHASANSDGADPYAAWFEGNPPDAPLDAELQQVKEFIARQKEKRKRVVLVTVSFT